MCMENWERELAIRASDGRSACTSEKVGTRSITNKPVLFLVKLQILPCKIETKEEHNHCKKFHLSDKFSSKLIIRASIIFCQPKLHPLNYSTCTVVFY